MEALITRDEAVAFFKAQLGGPGNRWMDNTAKTEHVKRRSGDPNAGAGAHHYGRCELYDLIDAIYGPETKESGGE